MINMHPSEYFKEVYFEPMNLSAEKVAETTKLPADVVKGFLAGVIDINAEIAMSFEKAFDRSAKSWLLMQSNYDLKNKFSNKS